MSKQDANDKVQNAMTVLQNVTPSFRPADGEVMTLVIEWPPGDPGIPPHRHPGGPCFGYVLEGEMVFELEGEPPRLIKAGEAFWEPGGDVIHFQDANNRTDIPLRFLVTMMMAPGRPMLVFVDDDELERRRWTRRPPDERPG
ncbi:Cupin domain protein [Saccharopolyspora shandongensis]|uniref:Cupin domain protein n=1 Tax=Saccharopolyspora shandongensis TaxID=418495 RepID=A0A1H3NAA7_9PSEU|nr:cupin domain-containing protein [Saccharopolyspora shandongensis]SDY85684.1 Cupin domain protein [Saccharopolyspora shandongensis]